LVLIALGLSGCKAAAQTDQRSKDVAQAPSQIEALACQGSYFVTDLTRKGAAKGIQQKRYYALSESNGELSVWSDDLGALVPLCRDWGDGCYVEIFPRKVLAKAAKSSRETLDLELFRPNGTLTINEQHFDELDTFAGTCRKGSLPTAAAERRAV
jgi:hypothetical protein